MVLYQQIAESIKVRGKVTEMCDSVFVPGGCVGKRKRDLLSNARRYHNCVEVRCSAVQYEVGP